MARSTRRSRLVAGLMVALLQFADVGVGARAIGASPERRRLPARWRPVAAAAPSRLPNPLAYLPIAHPSGVEPGARILGFGAGQGAVQPAPAPGAVSTGTTSTSEPSGTAVPLPATPTAAPAPVLTTPSTVAPGTARTHVAAEAGTPPPSPAVTAGPDVTVSGHVYAAGGAALPDARIQLSNGTTSAEAMAAADGSWSLSFPSGQASVFAMGPYPDYLSGYYASGEPGRFTTDWARARCSTSRATSADSIS